MKVHSKTSHPPCGGFTLLELLLVVAILGVLTGLAAPEVGKMVARYQTQATADQINALFVRAQVEALRRSGFVQLEKYAGIAGSNPCVANNDWSCGVRLMADTDKDGIYETVLEEMSITAGVTLTNASTPLGGGGENLPFDRWGRAAHTTKAAFVQSKAGRDSADLAVCVDSTSRIRTVKPSSLAAPCP